MNMKLTIVIVLFAFIVGCTSQQQTQEVPIDNLEAPAQNEIEEKEIKKDDNVEEIDIQEDKIEEQSSINSSIPSTTELEEPVSEEVTNKRPVLKNLGFDIEPWDRSKNLAGDLIFTKKLLFDDGNIMNEWVFVEFGAQGQRKNDLNKNIEYWFFVPLGTKVRAPADGIARVGYIDHSSDWAVNIDQGEGWAVSLEHVVNVKVKDGDIIKAGDIVGEASPRSTFDYKIAMTELAVWKGGMEVIKYCPFDFLEDSLKAEYKEKINRLAKDWEDFIDKDVYKQEKWVSPGCLVYSITER